jgi:glycine/D-amino acid oxidase-like deaminating enzyme
MQIWCVSGLAGSGFMRGPMAGFLCAELMTAQGHQKAQLENLLAPADPARFASLRQ